VADSQLNHKSSASANSARSKEHYGFIYAIGIGDPNLAYLPVSESMPKHPES
jgi:hypothetical protein